MKKETVYAIMLGVVFGVVFSVFMIVKTKDNQLGKSKPISNEKKIIPVKDDVNVQTQAFKITQPQDMQIVNTKSITFKGIAEKEGTLILQSPITDVAIKTQTDSFSINVPLALGENVINITFYAKDSQGKGQQKEMRVYYLDE